MMSSHGLDKLLDFSETVNLEKLRSNPQIKSGQPLEKNVSNNNEPQKCAYKPSNENVDTLGPPQPCAYDSSNKNTESMTSSEIQKSLMRMFIELLIHGLHLLLSLCINGTRTW